jgi:hypothetical protein
VRRAVYLYTHTTQLAMKIKAMPHHTSYITRSEGRRGRGRAGSGALTQCRPLAAALDGTSAQMRRAPPCLSIARITYCVCR